MQDLRAARHQRQASITAARHQRQASIITHTSSSYIAHAQYAAVTHHAHIKQLHRTRSLRDRSHTRTHHAAILLTLSTRPSLITHTSSSYFSLPQRPLSHHSTVLVHTIRPHREHVGDHLRAPPGVFSFRSIQSVIAAVIAIVRSPRYSRHWPKRAQFSSRSSKTGSSRNETIGNRERLMLRLTFSQESTCLTRPGLRPAGLYYNDRCNTPDPSAPQPSPARNVTAASVPFFHSQPAGSVF